MYTDNPLADFAAYELEQEKRIEKLPRCSHCDERIMEEYCFMVNDEPVCERCMNFYYRKAVDDLCL